MVATIFFKVIRKFTIFVFLFTVEFTFGQSECNGIPCLGESIGEVSFKTDRTWIIGNQEWSDVVIAKACQKESFNSVGADGSYCADCRSNLNDGDLFSWRTVVLFQNELCPNEWRVPSYMDFVKLHSKFGGSTLGGSFQDYEEVRTKYFNSWGCSLSGFCNQYGDLQNKGWDVGYWSIDEKDEEYGYNLFLNSNFIQPYYQNKSVGFPLRCVRDK